MKMPLFFRVLFLGIIPAFLLVFFALFLLNPSPAFQSPEEETAYWEKHGSQRKITEHELEQLKRNPSDFNYHAIFVRSYAELDNRDRKLVLPGFEKLFGNPEVYYHSLKKTAQRDLGIYASVVLTSSRSYADEWPVLLVSLDSIADLSLPFVNEIRGDLLGKMGMDNLGSYRKEWNLNPWNKTNYSKFLIGLVVNGEYAEATDALSKEPSLPFHLSIAERSFITWHLSNRIWFKGIYQPFYQSLFSIEGLFAFLIFAVWVCIVWLADLFHETRWSLKLVVIFVAVLVSPLCLTIYDFVYYSVQWFPQSELLKQIVLTGCIEEVTKFIPALLCYLIFARKTKSPLTLFTIASLSSLAFSFQENILYFAHYYDLSIVSGRAILSSALHMITGSILMYGIILNRYSGKAWYWIPLCFSMAVITHALYNFFLHQGLGFISVIMVIAGIFAWGSMLNNCLNNSPGFKENIVPRFQQQSVWMILGLCTIVLLEFVFNSFIGGFENGREIFAESLFKCAWIVPVIALSFNRLELEKAQWRLIDFAGIREFSFFVNPTERKITGVSPSGNALMPTGSGFNAVVVKKVRSLDDESWYLIKTDLEKLPLALIKFKEYGTGFYDFNVYVYLRKTDHIPPASFKAGDYPFVGFVMISPTVEQKPVKA